MAGWITKEIRLKLYHADIPSEISGESVYGARMPSGIATAFVPNSVDVVRNGETVGQIGGARVMPNTKIQGGVEVRIRDETETRQILEIPMPEMFELTVRAVGELDGNQIHLMGYISYFRYLDVCHNGEPALHVIMLTTKDGIIRWNNVRFTD